MLYTCADDFYQQAFAIKRITREEEIEYAKLMKENDSAARQAIINGYILIVAACIRRLPKEYQSLELIYRCIDILERTVDMFNFLQEGETFLHTLSVRLQPVITRYVVSR